VFTVAGGYMFILIDRLLRYLKLFFSTGEVTFIWRRMRWEDNIEM